MNGIKNQLFGTPMLKSHHVGRGLLHKWGNASNFNSFSTQAEILLELWNCRKWPKYTQLSKLKLLDVGDWHYNKLIVSE